MAKLGEKNAKPASAFFSILKNRKKTRHSKEQLFSLVCKLHCTKKKFSNKDFNKFDQIRRKLREILNGKLHFCAVLLVSTMVNIIHKVTKK